MKARRNKLTSLFKYVNLDQILSEADVPEGCIVEILQKLNKAALFDLYSRSKGEVENFSAFLKEAHVPFLSHGLIFNFLESKEESIE